MAGLSFEQIAARVQDQFGDAVTEVSEGERVPFVRVQADAVARVARFLHDDADLSFDFLMYIAGVDYPAEDKITVVYHYFSYLRTEVVVSSCSATLQMPI